MAVKIAFLDCDGTLTRVRSSWEYLHRRLNLWNNNAEEYQKLFISGKIDYHEFCRRDALLWKGLPVSKVKEVVDEIPYHEGSGEAVEALGKMGIHTVMISTGLSILVEKVRHDLGIHMAISNDLLAENGILTGGIRINVDYEKKGSLVEKILEEMGLSREEACAVGDGEGDTDMFKAVALPIGFHPTEHVLPHLAHASYADSLMGVVELVKQHI
ncbi:MAG: HAD family phosphatase [Syntrophobacterales bacterium]|jgi:phosphoserine phosphatase|nr:HAD family phosphatase [Syntrophobacterales bacterium]